jgi:uncharacterized membrane protein YphA (DoxX/SURF4 family)
MKEKIISIILRVSLGIVFFWFGIGKFTNDYWARTMAAMPFIQVLPWPANISVIAAGILEIITAFGLITGRLLRPAAVLASCQLIAILILLRFQEVRDIGLLGVAVYLALYRNTSKT